MLIGVRCHADRGEWLILNGFEHLLIYGLLGTIGQYHEQSQKVAQPAEKENAEGEGMDEEEMRNESALNDEGF